uniref:ATP-grasp domain-containing protein n=1 Tax=viral metagenome TaxID=1070528 RepID=A0A6C0I0S1_9ZZZZ
MIFIFLLLIILLILLMASIIINCRYGTNFTKIGGNFTKIGGNHNRFYYTISGENNGLDFSKLRNILSEYNFHPKPISEIVHISFGTFCGDNTDCKDNYDPLFIKQHAAIKNVLNGHNAICDKTLFYKTVKKLIPIGYKYIPQTYSVEEFDSHNIDNNNVYILKKKNAAQQRGVLVFSTMGEYLEAKKELNIHKYNGIISKYITNPLTVDGKKMHLRVYILVTIQSGITRCYIYDKYKIYNAEEVYIKQDWLNPKIHISGPNSISKQYIWPDDVFRSIDAASPPEELLNNMNECFRILCQGIALSKLSHYEESYSGYHLYGADILLTDNNKVYILEVNKRPGFGWIKTFSDKNASHNLFLFILNNAVFPFLGIKRLQNPIIEVCNNGNLLPFSNLLTGLNKNILIPISDATQDEIMIAYSFRHKLQLDITNKNINIYLISQNTIIIGFLILASGNYINIFIVKEFQNYKIDAAMIALLMEMQVYINYPHILKT